MKKVLCAVLVGSLTLSSCSVDDDSVSQETVDIPQNYVFERNGESTVYFGGQTTRLEMVKEIKNSFNNFETASEESLSNMYSNLNNPFSKASLNESDKSVKSKVAASKLYFEGNTVESHELKNDFEAYITEQVNEVSPKRNTVAAPGVAGQIADGDAVRYVNAKGLEMDQAFAKGLIGGLAADQMLNNYLSLEVLDEGDNVLNNNEKILKEGTNYTIMEHKWDEAYGYLYGDPAIPADDPNSALGTSGDILLFNYLGKVENDSDFQGIADDIFQAFKTGRAAIVAGDYDLRNQQIGIIRENVSKIIAVRSIYYMQKGKRQMESGNTGSAFHQLAEGYGFIYSLRFTHNPATGQPYFSGEEVEAALDQLMAGNGFWDVDPQTLDFISEAIASKFGISVAEAAQ